MRLRGHQVVWCNVNTGIHLVEGLEDTQVVEPGAEAAGLLNRLVLLPASIKFRVILEYATGILN